MTTLLESGARPYGSTKGMALSVVLHSALIGAAIIGTAAVALPPREKIEEHAILYVAPKPAEPVHVAPKPLPDVKTPKAAKSKAPAVKRAEAPRPRPAPAAQPKAPTMAMVPAPAKVPLSIPAIDLKTPVVGDIVAPPAVTDRIASSGVSRRTSSESDGEVEGSSGRGLNSGSAARAYSENEVERTVEVMSAPVPKYPESLKSVNVEGVVVMHFIVGTNGRVEPGSISVVSSPHKLFSDAVRTALLNAKFRPAQAGGHAVRQLVEQSFSFRLDK